MKKLFFVLCLLVSLVPYVSAESYSDRELTDFVRKSDNGDGYASFKLHVYYSDQGKAELARHYLFKGAKQGDMYCCREVGTAYEKGLLGLPRDFKTAVKWYYKAMPADWDDEKQQVENVLNDVGQTVFHLGVSEKWDMGLDFPIIRPTKAQLFLAALDERKELRTYFKKINTKLTMRPPGSKVDIDLVKVVAAGSGKPNVSGLTSRRYGDKPTVMNRIDIYFDEINKHYPYRNTAESFWKRQVQLVDTCAHELAHAYFSQRYPLIANCSNESQNRLYEGHATNAAYEYIKREFCAGQLKPEKYAELLLSDDYKEYFFWFRTNCLMPDEKAVMWHKIDTWEREAARGQEPFTRTQVSWEEFPLVPLLLPPA